MPNSMHTGSFQWMKSVNKSTILNVIRLQGPIARAEIAKVTRLTPPTVTNIVAELLYENMVLESDLGKSTGGRKPILLKINASAFQVVGVHAGEKKVRVISANLNGKIGKSVQLPIRKGISSVQYLCLIKEAVRQVLKRDERKGPPLLGIGVGVFGWMDEKCGTSLSAISHELKQTFGVPVEIESDIRALAMGESWFGQGKGVSDFICVQIGSHVKAGLIMNDRLIQGHSLIAGALGHMMVDVKGPSCRCGNHGCLEAFASTPGMMAHIQERLDKGEDSLLQRYRDTQRLNLRSVLKAAELGDMLSLDILSGTGRLLGVGLANLVHLLNPSKIILSGDVVTAGPVLWSSLRKEVERRTQGIPKSDVQIVLSELGVHAREMGSLALILKRLFEPHAMD